MRASLVALLVLALVGCGGDDWRDGVEDWVRQAQQDAESKNADALLALVSDRYRDDHGRGKAQLDKIVREWLSAQRELHLLTRIELPTDDREPNPLLVRVYLARTAAPIPEQLAAMRFRGDTMLLELSLSREGGELKVQGATWRRHSPPK